jgi:electron transfer flavoprotein alpha subunit
MSVLVYCEHAGGKFKKSTFEVVSYAAEIAAMQGTSLTALSIGDVSNDELAILGKYGASKVLTVSNDRLKQFVNMAYGAVIAMLPNRYRQMWLFYPLLFQEKVLLQELP